MSEEAPSRGLILELREERDSMRDGHTFLEEKSLLLAAEIVRELARHEVLRARAGIAAEVARDALAAALARHGLEELGVLPAPAPGQAELALARRAVVGVPLLDARFSLAPGAAALPWSSPEARAAAAAFTALVTEAAALGAVAGNLERLSAEYRRTIRRERALADVLIPALEQRLDTLEARLEDLEREDAVAMRQGARHPGPG